MKSHACKNIGDQIQQIREISAAAIQIGKITEQTAALSEENATASEELATQAASMRQFVQDVEDLVGK
jgi:methyl-accepting chemotaxis protein